MSCCWILIKYWFFIMLINFLIIYFSSSYYLNHVKTTQINVRHTWACRYKCIVGGGSGFWWSHLFSLPSFLGLFLIFGLLIFWGLFLFTAADTRLKYCHRYGVKLCPIIFLLGDPLIDMKMCARSKWLTANMFCIYAYACTLQWISEILCIGIIRFDHFLNPLNGEIVIRK